MQKLKADIKNRQFKNCYLFYGEEDYLKRLYRDSLKAAVLNGGDDMNCTRFQGKETDVVQIKDLADTLPFFSDYRLIIVENSGLFKSANDLADYLPNMPDSTILLFVETRTAGTCQNHFPVRRHHQRGNKTIRREKRIPRKSRKKREYGSLFHTGRLSGLFT